MSKRKSKRLFPKHMQASAVRTSRIDHNKAAAYNAQRSKAVTGVRGDTEMKLDNNFMEEIPRTRSLSTHDPELFDGKTGLPIKFSKSNLPGKHRPGWRSERGKVVDTLHKVWEVERKDVWGLYKVWQGQMSKQGVSEYFCRKLEIREGYRLLLFFSGAEFIFIQEVSYRNTRRYSKIYSDLREATDIYSQGVAAISWHHEEPLA